METAPLKSFATWARTALIREVSARITAVLAPASKDRVESASVIAALERDIAAEGGGETGRDTVANAAAYTWFNRIIALRFMDANGYTGIGVVSPPRGQTTGQPEILADAKRGSIDSAVVTNKRAIEAITALLDGTRRSDDPQGETYALLLAEYCRHWNRSMPFMFEREGDYTELLIPANLLADDSVIARAVCVLTEDVCRDVEVIGWLYQFYISERKDEVFAGFRAKGSGNRKAGAAEIPAATQLFTPHWIVRYLVENSLGRLWLLNRPTSRLADQMDYYIKPVCEETVFLKVSGPEDLRIIDPAVGSGHILTYAFDLLYAIYEEDGYAPADIPGLILRHNLFGTEIDPRAGALAAFALAMKARAKQRTFFSKALQPNVRVLAPIYFEQQELDYLANLSDPGTQPGAYRDHDRRDIDTFWNAFKYADTRGSLIQPREELIDSLRRHIDEHPPKDGDLIGAETHLRAAKVVEQSEYLSRRYTIAIANPPYMGGGNMGAHLSEWIRVSFPMAKQDLYGCFVLRSLALIDGTGYVAMVTGDTWMTIKSFEPLRRTLMSRRDFLSLVHMHDVTNHPDVFGANTAFVLGPRSEADIPRRFFFLDENGSAAKQTEFALAIDDRTRASSHEVYPTQFLDVPGAPLAFRLTPPLVRLLIAPISLSEVLPAVAGISTGSNERFFRYWPEVSRPRIGGAHVDKPWAPHHKGGPERRWFGNVAHVLQYDADSVANMEKLPGFRHDGRSSYFQQHIGWSALTSGSPSFRLIDAGHTFGSGSKAIVGNESALLRALALLNSSLAIDLLAGLSPTMNFEVGHIGRLPMIPDGVLTSVETLVASAISFAREEWDEQELSLDYLRSPLIGEAEILVEAVRVQRIHAGQRAEQLRQVEVEIDAEVHRVFGVDCEPTPVSDRSDSSLSNVSDLVVDLISYGVGCMFGRYSLNEPGLILANQGDTLREYLAKVSSPSFLPDKDNVIPIVDGDWFEDDIVARFRQFLRIAFGEEHFEENLRFVTESLGVNDLRNYFMKSFYTDHVQRYKKRPIYWLFSSPKGSFNALIYMHRYTPSTVSTVLNEYLREFKAKLEASRKHHERLALGTGTPRDKAAAEKEVDRLRKVLLELDEYEHDVLYPLATQQLAMDLDDGVLVNYLRFGEALAPIPEIEKKRAEVESWSWPRHPLRGEVDHG